MSLVLADNSYRTFAANNFTFVADENIIDNPPRGIVFPASNPDLIEYVNEHTYEIHNSLNEILAYVVIRMFGMDDIENIVPPIFTKIDCVRI